MPTFLEIVRLAQTVTVFTSSKPAGAVFIPAALEMESAGRLKESLNRTRAAPSLPSDARSDSGKSPNWRKARDNNIRKKTLSANQNREQEACMPICGNGNFV